MIETCRYTRNAKAGLRYVAHSAIVGEGIIRNLKQHTLNTITAALPPLISYPCQYPALHRQWLSTPRLLSSIPCSPYILPCLMRFRQHPVGIVKIIGISCKAARLSAGLTGKDKTGLNAFGTNGFRVLRQTSGFELGNGQSFTKKRARSNRSNVRLPGLVPGLSIPFRVHAHTISANG